MKLTEPKLNTLIDNLNALICEDSLLTRQEREDLVRAVAAIGAMKARVSMKKSSVPAASKLKEEKQERVPDPRFPHAGEPWREEEGCLMPSNPYRTKRWAFICSGWPKSWGVPPTVWPVK